MSSLLDMGKEAYTDVLGALHDITGQHYSWQQFIDLFGWTPLNLNGPDIFPGGNELHQFQIHSAPNRSYTVVGYTHDNVIVVCAIARKV